MNMEIRRLEDDVVASVRKRYEAHGYRFVPQPTPAELPTFLEGAVPDAIATRDGENVVVEFKSDDLAERKAKVRRLAEEVPKHPGWRFDLVLARPRQETIDAPLEPSKSELRAELEKTRKIALDQGFGPPLAYAWGLLEATARLLVLNERRGAAKRYPPTVVVEALVSDGFVDDERGNELFTLGEVRNQILHGFTRAAVSKQKIDLLLDTIEELIAEIPDDDA